MNVDCTALLRAGEVEDEEASAASKMLAALFDIWREDWFTSGDIVNLTTMAVFADESERQKVASLSDALFELADKRFERLTPVVVGKLLQRNLVGRATWIRNGKATAMLVRNADHNQNTYRVAVRPGDRT